LKLSDISPKGHHSQLESRHHGLLGIGDGKLIGICAQWRWRAASCGSMTKIILKPRPEFAIYALAFAIALNTIAGIYPA
jgi:ABC-type lipoprotein release transport system permease subunit